MIARESVKARLESDNGISFTEFSYQLLQANDYLHLFRNHEVELQIGGSDQWGNILAGVDLIRKSDGRHAHAFTWPLLLRSDGKKFGKSEEGAVWLAADRTSPYQFFQYWMNVADADIERFLLQLTLLPVAECRESRPRTPSRRTSATASAASPRRSQRWCTAPRRPRPPRRRARSCSAAHRQARPRRPWSSSAPRSPPRRSRPG